jgi:hypothetical protein
VRSIVPPCLTSVRRMGTPSPSRPPVRYGALQRLPRKKSLGRLAHSWKTFGKTNARLEGFSCIL